MSSASLEIALDTYLKEGKLTHPGILEGELSGNVSLALVSSDCEVSSVETRLILFVEGTSSSAELSSVKSGSHTVSQNFISFFRTPIEEQRIYKKCEMIHTSQGIMYQENSFYVIAFAISVI